MMRASRLKTLLEGWTAGLLAVMLVAGTACGDETKGGGGSGDTGTSQSDTAQTDTGVPDTATPPDTGEQVDTTPQPDTEFDFDTNVPADTGTADAAQDTGTPDLALGSITPKRGPVEGGTQFVIEGQGFTENTAVYFGSRQATVQLVDGKLVGQTPEGAGVGAVAVKALDSETGEDVIAGGFKYTATLKFDGASPDRIPTEGGTEITITGQGFGSETRASFDGATARRHTVVDSQTLRVVVPAGDKGPADLRLTNRDATVVAEGAVSYFEPLTIDSVRPATGPTSGGTTAVIEGQGFEKGMTVRFAGKTATVQSVDAKNGRATVATPPVRSPGLVDVVVETPSGDAEIATDAFYYQKSTSEFALAAVSPAVAPESGMVDVTLIGAGLDASGLAVEFGGQSATVVSQGPGHAVVTVPAHPPGTVNVTVRDGQATTATLAQSFRYVPDLSLDTVMPAEGKVAGGKQVTLSGKGFNNASKVLFGGIPASFKVVSDTEITATTPRHGPGAVDVVVERGDLESRLADSFTYTESLEVFGFSPVRGSIAGNTYVEVRGRGFVDNQMAVKFGPDAGKSVKVLDAQTLAVRTPAHKPEAVDVVVERGSDSIKADQQYTFFNPGARNGGAWGGPIQGAVNVSVFSQGGSPIPNAFVMLSTNPKTTYKGKTDRDGLVTLSGPDVYGEQTITAVAPKYSSTTVQHVDAENITIFLSPPPSNRPPGPGPPTATFKGNISGLNKIAEPGPNEFHMAAVYATKKSPWSREPGPGNGNVVMADGPYTLQTRIGDLALVAVGGLYNSKTEELTPLRMGVKRFQYAAEGKVYQRDIDLNIPMNQTLTFKLKSPPKLNANKTASRVVPWLDFGFEGVFGQVFAFRSSGKFVQADHMPQLAGQLSDVSYLAIGGKYAVNEMSGQLTNPQAAAIKRNITATSSVIDLPTLPGVADITSPASGQRPVNGLIQFQTGSSVKPDFWYAQVLTAMGSTVWDAFVPGTSTSVRLPDFPDFSSYPADMRPEPYPAGGYQLVIIGIRHPGISYGTFTYSDLSIDKWEAYSVGAQIIRF